MEGAIGTRLRHVLELLDGDVAQVYVDAGLPEYRPRFSPIIRALVAEGPLSIRALAVAVGVTHSAASQTVAQLNRSGFVKLEPGKDARQRIVHLTDKTRSLLPTIEAEWQATTAALTDLDAELSAPLAQVLDEIVAAVERRSFRLRINEHAAPGAASGGVVEDESEGVAGS
jgi:DNA-binding MarR family transcriptional regulator